MNSNAEKINTAMGTSTKEGEQEPLFGDLVYDKQFRHLQGYIPVVGAMMKKIEGKEEDSQQWASQMGRLRSLMAMLTDTKKKMKGDTLSKCEAVLVKLAGKLDTGCHIPTANKGTANAKQVHPRSDDVDSQIPAKHATPENKSVSKDKSEAQISPDSPPQEESTAVPTEPTIIPTEKREGFVIDINRTPDSVSALNSFERSRNKLKKMMPIININAESSSKVAESSSKVAESSSKVAESSSKVAESSSKVAESSSKVTVSRKDVEESPARWENRWTPSPPCEWTVIDEVYDEDKSAPETPSPSSKLRTAATCPPRSSPVSSKLTQHASDQDSPKKSSRVSISFYSASPNESATRSHSNLSPTHLNQNTHNSHHKTVGESVSVKVDPVSVYKHSSQQQSTDSVSTISFSPKIESVPPSAFNLPAPSAPPLSETDLKDLMSEPEVVPTVETISKGMPKSLRAKLEKEISKVHRVGLSVGGSLRSLVCKDAKNRSPAHGKETDKDKLSRDEPKSRKSDHKIVEIDMFGKLPELDRKKCLTKSKEQLKGTAKSLNMIKSIHSQSPIRSGLPSPDHSTESLPESPQRKAQVSPRMDANKPASKQSGILAHMTPEELQRIVNANLKDLPCPPSISADVLNSVKQISQLTKFNAVDMDISVSPLSDNQQGSEGSPKALAGRMNINITPISPLAVSPQEQVKVTETRTASKSTYSGVEGIHPLLTLPVSDPRVKFGEQHHHVSEAPRSNAPSDPRKRSLLGDQYSSRPCLPSAQPSQHVQDQHSMPPKVDGTIPGMLNAQQPQQPSPNAYPSWNKPIQNQPLLKPPLIERYDPGGSYSSYESARPYDAREHSQYQSNSKWQNDRYHYTSYNQSPGNISRVGNISGTPCTPSYSMNDHIGGGAPQMPSYSGNYDYEQTAELTYPGYRPRGQFSGPMPHHSSVTTSASSRTSSDYDSRNRWSSSSPLYHQGGAEIPGRRPYMDMGQRTGSFHVESSRSYKAESTSDYGLENRSGGRPDRDLRISDRYPRRPSLDEERRLSRDPRTRAAEDRKPMERRQDPRLCRDDDHNRDVKDCQSATESRRDSNTKSRRDSNTDSRRDSNTDSRRDSNTDSRRDSNTDSRRDSNTDSRRDSNTDSRRDSNTDSRRDSNTDSRRDSNTDSRRDSNTDSKRDSTEARNKISEPKRSSTDELVSPLTSLYGSTIIPQTGKGYGFQSFRIPKIKRDPPPRIRSPTPPLPRSPSPNLKDDSPPSPVQKPISTDEIPSGKALPPEVETTHQDSSSQDSSRDVNSSVEVHHEVSSTSPDESVTVPSKAVEEKKDKPFEITQEFIEDCIRKTIAEGGVEMVFKLNKLINAKKSKKIDSLRKMFLESSSDSESEEEIKKAKQKKNQANINSDDEADVVSVPKEKTKKKRILISDDSEEECAGKESKDVDTKTKPEPSVLTGDNSVEEQEDSEASKDGATLGVKKRGRKPKRGRKKLPVIAESPQPSPVENKKPDSESNEAPPAVTSKKHKKHRNELEMLQCDIRDMFISEGVVTATGKRMCRLIKEAPAGMTIHELSRIEAKRLENEILSKKEQNVKKKGKEVSKDTDEESNEEDKTTREVKPKVSKRKQKRLTSSPVLQAVDTDSDGDIPRKVENKKIARDKENCEDFIKPKGSARKSKKIDQSASDSGKSVSQSAGDKSDASSEGTDIPKKKRKYVRKTKPVEPYESSDDSDDDIILAKLKSQVMSEKSESTVVLESSNVNETNLSVKTVSSSSDQVIPVNKEAFKLEKSGSKCEPIAEDKDNLDVNSESDSTGSICQPKAALKANSVSEKKIVVKKQTKLPKIIPKSIELIKDSDDSSATSTTPEEISKVGKTVTVVNKKNDPVVTSDNSKTSISECNIKLPRVLLEKADISNLQLSTTFAQKLDVSSSDEPLFESLVPLGNRPPSRNVARRGGKKFSRPRPLQEEVSEKNYISADGAALTSEQTSDALSKDDDGKPECNKSLDSVDTGSDSVDVNSPDNSTKRKSAQLPSKYSKSPIVLSLFRKQIGKKAKRRTNWSLGVIRKPKRCRLAEYEKVMADSEEQVSNNSSQVSLSDNGDKKVESGSGEVSEAGKDTDGVELKFSVLSIENVCDTNKNENLPETSEKSNKGNDEQLGHAVADTPKVAVDESLIFSASGKQNNLTEEISVTLTDEKPERVCEENVELSKSEKPDAAVNEKLKTENNEKSSTRYNLELLTKFKLELVVDEKTPIETPEKESMSEDVKPVASHESSSKYVGTENGLADVNYVLESDPNFKYYCKLCSYHGKMIVYHYKNVHPECEVYISRLNLEDARVAIEESDSCHFTKEMQTLTLPKNSDNQFTCRVCFVRVAKPLAFFEHCSSHTGEYRIQCNICSATVLNRSSLGSHCQYHHKGSKRKLAFTVLHNGPIRNAAYVFGFICSICNFVQMQEVLVENHIKTYHQLDAAARPVRINMSVRTENKCLKQPRRRSTNASLRASTEDNLDVDSDTNDEHGSSDDTDIHLQTSSPLLPTAMKNSDKLAVPGSSFTCNDIKPNILDVTPGSSKSSNSSSVNIKEKIKTKEFDLSVFVQPDDIKEKELETEKLIREKRLKVMQEIAESFKNSNPNFLNPDKISITDVISKKLNQISNHLNESPPEKDLTSQLTGNKDKKQVEAPKTKEPARVTTVIDSNLALQAVSAVKKLPEASKQLLSETELKRGRSTTFTITNMDNLEIAPVFSPNSSGSETPPFEEEGMEEILDPLGPKKSSNLMDNLIQRLQLNLVKTSSIQLPLPVDLKSDPDESRIVIVGPFEVKQYTFSNLFTCKIDNCLYTSTRPAQFVTHVEENHSASSWDGVCKICKDTCLNYNVDKNERPVSSALLHLLRVHLITTATQEQETLLAHLAADSTSDAMPGSSDLDALLAVDSDTESSVQEPPVVMSPVVIESDTTSSSDLMQFDSSSKPKGYIRMRRLSGDKLSVAKEAENSESSQMQIDDDFLSIRIESVISLNPDVTKENEMDSEACDPLLGDLEPSLEQMPTSSLHQEPSLNKPNRSFVSAPAATQGSPYVGQPVTALFVSAPAATQGSPYVGQPVTALGAAPDNTFKSFSSIAILPAVIEHPVSVAAQVAGYGPGQFRPILPCVKKRKVSEVLKAGDVSSLEEKICESASSSSCGSQGTNSENGDASGPVSTLLSLRHKPGFDPSNLKRLKAPNLYEEMLSHKKLRHLYKCMNFSCSFTTNVREHFEVHLLKHEKDLTKEQDGTKKKRRKRSSWDLHHCAYCCQTFPSKMIADHIDDEHGNCLYQCAYCFHRAMSPSYIVLHQNLSHVEANISILLCIRSSTVKEDKEDPVDKADFIHPFICRQGECSQVYFVVNEFEEHLMKSHSALFIYTCNVCENQTFNPKRLIGHYRLHNINLYQCLYCQNGTLSRDEMHHHLCNNHANRVPLVLIREFDETKTLVCARTVSSQLDRLKIINLEEGESIDTRLILKPQEEDLVEDDLMESTDATSGLSNEIPNFDNIPIIFADDINGASSLVGTSLERGDNEGSDSENSLLVIDVRMPGTDGAVPTTACHTLTTDDVLTTLTTDDILTTLTTDDILAHTEGNTETENTSLGKESLATSTISSVSNATPAAVQGSEAALSLKDDGIMDIIDIDSSSEDSADNMETPLTISSVLEKMEDDVPTFVMADVLNTSAAPSLDSSFGSQVNEGVLTIDIPSDSDANELVANLPHITLVSLPTLNSHTDNSNKDDANITMSSAVKEDDSSECKKDLKTTPVETTSDLKKSLRPKNNDTSGSAATKVSIISGEKEKSTEFSMPKPSVPVPDPDSTIPFKYGAISAEELAETGLSGEQLYKCGYIGCSYPASDVARLKDHLMVCDFSRNSQCFQCFHCRKNLKHLNGFLDHISSHSTARYGCGLCPFRSTGIKQVTNHLRQRHRVITTVCVPLNPKEWNTQTALFVVGPKEKTGRRGGGRKLSTTGKKRNVFHPNEVHLLPRSPIYTIAASCGMCSFSTKVRSNIVRHLKLHESGLSAPTKCPINPVPCLERSEMMFDKMTNLAASSHAVTKPDPASLVMTAEDLAMMPKYIPEKERYVCGAPGCSYSSCDENMLLHHVQALHREEINIICPHCPVKSGVDFEPIPVSRLAMHLKMHDGRLYKCGYCIYHHYQRYLIDRHLAEKHKDKRPHLHVVRELDSGSSAAEEQEEPAAPAPKAPWQCNLCTFDCSTRAEVVSHTSTVHAIKSQFKCGICTYRSSSKHNFDSHFSSKHAGVAVQVMDVYSRTGGPEPEAPPPVFDTTPIWRRDMLGVKHIRGILLEEEQLKPEELRALARKAEGNEMRDLEERFGPLGKPLPNSLYNCTLCNDYKTKFRADMRDHLFRELKYAKFQCAHCDKKTCNKNYLQKHIPRAHPNELTPSSIVALPIEEDIEDWVELLLTTQGDLMKTVDSSTPGTAKHSGGKTAGHAAQPKSSVKSTAKQSPRAVAKAAALSKPSTSAKSVTTTPAVATTAKTLSPSKQSTSPKSVATTKAAATIATTLAPPKPSTSAKSVTTTPAATTTATAISPLKPSTSAKSVATTPAAATTVMPVSLLKPSTSAKSVTTTPATTVTGTAIKPVMMPLSPETSQQPAVVSVDIDTEEEIDVTSNWAWEDRVTVSTLPCLATELDAESDPEVSILSEGPSLVELTDSDCSSPSKKRRRLPPKRFPCAHCGEKFGTIRGLKSHIKLNHLAMGRWRCNVCKGTHNSEIFMKKHCQTKHPEVTEDLYALNPNASKVLTDAWWNEHYSIEQIERDFDVASTSSDGHVITIEKVQLGVGGENTVLSEESQVKRCTYCDFKCKSCSELRRHEMRHWTQKPFKCGHCDFDAIRQFEIKKHSAKIHPYKKYHVIKVDTPQNPDIRPIKTKRKPDLMDDTDDKSEISVSNTEDSLGIESLPDSNTGSEGEQHLEVFKCHYCPFRGSTMRVVYDHWESLHQNKVVLANGSIKTGTGLIFKCKKINFKDETDNKNMRQMNFTCGYCKKRGSRSFLLEHQQEAHPGKQFVIAHLPVIKYECSVCKFQSNTSVTMKKHWFSDHSHMPLNFIVTHEKSSSRVAKQDDFVNVKYFCQYCDEQLGTLTAIINHLSDYHSHLDQKYTVKSAETVPVDVCPESSQKGRLFDLFVQKYKCPLCSFTGLEHRYVREHLRHHSRPLHCSYCESTFDFINQLQAHSLCDHPNTKISFKSLEDIEEEHQRLVSQISIVVEEVGEYTTGKRSVARKSTALPPRCMVKQVARKSTTPHLRQTFATAANDDEDMDDNASTESLAPNLPGEFSFYGSKPVSENFENLKTRVQFGPSVVTISVDSMLKGINIAPKLVVKDIKNLSSLETEELIKRGSSH